MNKNLLGLSISNFLIKLSLLNSKIRVNLMKQLIITRQVKKNQKLRNI